MKKYLLILFLTTSQLFAQETAEENAKIAFEFVWAGENADEFIAKALELDKDYPFTYVSRGLQHQYVRKDIALALKDFDLAIKLDDKTGFALYFKALILLENDKQKACELIQKAKELNNYRALSFKECD